MPTALVVSPEAPFPAIGGGALRTASLVAYLAGRYTVDLIVFREPGAADPRSLAPPGLVRRLDVVDLPYHRRSRLARAGRNAVRLWRGRPPLNDRFGGFGAEFEWLLRGRRYDLAVIEHFWCAPYCEQLAAHAGRLILDLHNVESVFYGRCASAGSWPAAAAFRRFQQSCRTMEQRWLPRFSLALAPSLEDMRALRAIAPGCRCEVYPNAIPPVPQPVEPEEHVVMFSGNLEYYPNVSAVRHFRRLIWPLLAERWPRLRWRIIGKNPSGVAACVRGDPRIELWGPVKDAVQALATAEVVVVPLLAGSGTRVKILEAWAAGRPVVSTSLGAEGLPASHGLHLLVADAPREFAAAVSDVLESAALRLRLGRNGRALLEEQFTWPAAWKHLDALGL